MPAFDSGDDFVGIGCPSEGLWRRRIDLKPDHIAQFQNEFEIGRELELPPHRVRLQPCTELTLIPVCFVIMAAVQCVASLGVRATKHSATSAPVVQWRPPCLIAQQTVETRFRATPLPAPDISLRLAGLARARVGARAIG